MANIDTYRECINTLKTGIETIKNNETFNLPTLQKNASLYLVQEGTGKTWAEYGSENNPYVPRDVLSRAHATKNMVDDYLRGVGMPRNNRRVEQMLGIGY